MILWKTWDDRLMEFDRLSHQHLSNIHYYMNLVHPEYYPKSLKSIVRHVLYKKHKGILPYHPDPNFAYEKIKLISLGYLKNNGDIVVHNHKVGWYES